MSIKTLIYGLATLPLLVGVAIAAPKQPLSDRQMDKVTAGWDFFELTVSNESATVVAVHERGPQTGLFGVPSTEYPPGFNIGYNVTVTPGVGTAAATVTAGPYNNSIYCPTCFINISNPALSVAASFR